MDQQSRLRFLMLKWKRTGGRCCTRNLISAVDGSMLNWCEQRVLLELMSEDLLFGKIAEPELTVVNFDDHFRDRMGEVERGHIEVFPKL